MEEWKNPETISLWITIIIVFVLLLATSIVILSRSFFKKLLEVKLKESETLLLHQRELLSASVSAQEKERKRVAADLHDDLIGKLVGVQLKHQISHPESALGFSIQECITRAREISHDLSPPMIEQLTVSELLSEIVEDWKVQYHVQVQYLNSIDKEVSSDFKLHLCRIIKELFNNAHKHARANRIEVLIKASPDQLYILFKDDGVGYDHNQQSKGIGMKNLEARVQCLQGGFKVKSKPNLGTRVILHLNTKA